MEQNNKDAALTSYPFGELDIQLITYALRRFAGITNYNDLKNDSLELIEYIERLQKENK